MIHWDLETDRFGPCNLAPEPICLGLYDDEGGNSLVVSSSEEHFDDVVETCLLSEQSNMNIAYDMAVIMAHRPKMRDLVFDAYEEQRVYDIAVREKLITLGITGDLEFHSLPNGALVPLKFSLADIEKRRLGIDRSAEKEGDDNWRTHFNMLKGLPASEYPAEAKDYVLSDCINAGKIFRAQEKQVAEGGLTVLGAQHLTVRASLGLYLSSAWGFAIKSDEVDKKLEELHAIWDDDAVRIVDGKAELVYRHMLELGILKPKQPSKPYGNQMRKAEAILGFKPADWLKHREQLEAAGVKFTQPKKSSYSMAPLHQRVREACARIEMEVPMTSGGESGEKSVRFDKEVQQELAGLDPALDEYIERKSIEKLVTTELPRIAGHSRVHPKYDILKKTSRTSSYGNKKEELNPPYPAVNIQQIDPRARELYIPSPGRILCSTDYSAIELASAAQKCITLFGESVLGDKINAGMDAHAFLGAQIARMFSKGEFVGSPDPDENYLLFQQLKATNEPFFKHYRKLAKPTGLGFPGGLGAARFIGYAKTTYGVDLVALAGGSFDAAVQLAKDLKEVWLATFPEFKAYFTWVNKNCIDVEFSIPGDKRYAYISPMGTVRRNCRYTEATNGAALQTPTAEGAKNAIWLLTKAIYDPRQNSPLYGNPISAFVHDEFIVDMIHDEFTHERAFAVAELMVEGMRLVIKDVQVKAEPCLMFRWNKAAEPVYDNNNRLIPWLPRSAA